MLIYFKSISQRRDLRTASAPEDRGMEVSGARSLAAAVAASHWDEQQGSIVSQNKPYVKKAVIPCQTNIIDKQITNDPKQNFSSKMSGTPVKMLIAQEMSTDIKSKQKPLSVVARLMGLDDELKPQPCPEDSQNKSQEGLNQAYFAARTDCHQQDILINKAVPSQTHQSDRQKEQGGANEVWQKSTQKRGSCEGNQNEIKMMLARQKFMEAKSLAIDGKFLHSKEFQDALDVLSSNRDLFLKFLDEPNSLFTKQLNNLPFAASPQTKPTTVLKPSKDVEAQSTKMAKKQEYPENNESACGTKTHQCDLSFNTSMAKSVSHPTRIVVLKPSTGKTTRVPTPTISPEYQVRQYHFGDQSEIEAFRTAYTVNRSTGQMQKTFSGHKRDESLLSSVVSDRCGREGSSFDLSEIYYMENDDGFSDSEMDIVTQTSRQSWDRSGSPCSLSSFSKVSKSPESSVIREAKRRLSERWALMASNGMKEAQLSLPRNTTTLGEMLAISEVKREECVHKSTVSSSESCVGEDEMRQPAFCFSVGRTINSRELSPGNLSRSKSVPVSSSAYDDVEKKIEDPHSHISKSTVLEVSRANHGNLSFGGKVSSFFFSRSKKANRERPVSSLLVGTYDADLEVVRTYLMPKSTESCLTFDNKVNDEEESIVAASPVAATNVSAKAMLMLAQGKTADKSNEKQERFIPKQNFINNLDQPSPNSILDAPFEDDVEKLSQLSEDNAGKIALSRSSHIESIARSLSWEDTHLEMLYHKPSSLHTLPMTEDDQECFAVVWKLLSYAGFEEWDMIFNGWHSLDSPLDPILLDNFINWREEESMEKRSNLRLIFDCVNSALLELSCNTLMSIWPHNRTCRQAQLNAHTCSSLADVVWDIIRDWFYSNKTNLFAETNGILVVDTTLRKEVGRFSWAKTTMVEIEELTKEISGEVLEDLLSEALNTCLS
ncbi:hypothetical protein ZIOFF_023025 [Zingiber officinale]|uniref:Phosphatidylinositol N-acetyglucosaminlytransferase subunit P-related n=1 Tax=Zingiber officinale TaxID=94328 RepID=A0A8J5HMD7_ZINOF|nr:hypothetical protein ZIOFF_023025 [Zingiber officinale]